MALGHLILPKCAQMTFRGYLPNQKIAVIVGLLYRPSIAENSFVKKLDQQLIQNDLESLRNVQEVSRAVAQMNNGMSAEHLKSSGLGFNDILHKVFLSVCAEGVPQGWRYGLLISLSKKSSTDLCDNYRGIALISIVGKVFVIVICNSSGILMSFRCGRGAVDMIFRLASFRKRVLKTVMISISVSSTLRRRLTRLTVG